MWDAAIWHTGGINRGNSPRYTVITFWQSSWVRGTRDPQRLISPEVRDQLSEEAKSVMGLLPTMPTHTWMRDMTPEQVAALTPEEQAVLGLAPYE